MDSILASHPAALGSILGAPVPSFIKHCLVSGQWHSDKPEVGVLKSSGSVCQCYKKMSSPAVPICLHCDVIKADLVPLTLLSNLYLVTLVVPTIKQQNI